MADQQTYAEWLKANPAPNFAALIAAMAVTRRSPRKLGRHLPMPRSNGNAVGGCALPRTVRIGRSPQDAHGRAEDRSDPEALQALAAAALLARPAASSAHN
jgi:hypothetical protein